MLAIALQTVYNAGKYDNWRGSLITSESEKVHSTFNNVISKFTNIIISPNTSQEDKDWAKRKIDEIMNS
jgi:hypothetical protein